MSFFLYVICDEALLSPNQYSRYSSFVSSWTYPHNVAPMKSLSTSLSLYFPFFIQQSTARWPLFSKLLHYPLKRVFLAFLLLFLFSFLFLYPQQYDALWSYLSKLLHYPLKNLPFLLLLFFSLVFNAIIFSSYSSFSCVFLLFIYVFHNQYVSFLKYLDSIFVTLMLQYTLTGFYYSGKT